MGFLTAGCTATRVRPAVVRRARPSICPVRSYATPTSAASPPVRAPPRCFSLEAASVMVARTCARVGVSSEVSEQLEQLSQLVVSEGAHVNLSGVRSVSGALVTHVVDALSLVPLLDAADASDVVDVGAGAGFPGLVLAAARPHCRVTLVEASRKKVNFQELAIRNLGLQNVDPVWARAEEYARGEGWQKYDVAVARAVARMAILAELAVPLIRRGGLFVAQKSLDERHEEVRQGRRAVEVLGGQVAEVKEAWTEEIVREVAKEFGEEMENEDERRKCIVVVEKIRDTPRVYPRLFNAIKKNSL